VLSLLNALNTFSVDVSFKCAGGVGGKMHWTADDMSIHTIHYFGDYPTQHAFSNNKRREFHKSKQDDYNVIISVTVKQFCTITMYSIITTTSKQQ